MPKYRDLNPATLNAGIFSQLQPDPFKLNQPFVEQLEQVIPSDPLVVPTLESSESSSDADFFTQAEAISSPIDDIWQTDDLNIFS